jgi:hypothetical protein
VFDNGANRVFGVLPAGVRNEIFFSYRATVYRAESRNYWQKPTTRPLLV